MTFEIGDGLEKLAGWLLAIPDSIPVLLGADPHNAGLVRAMAALALIALIIYVIAKRPLRAVLSLFKGRDRASDKSN